MLKACFRAITLAAAVAAPLFFPNPVSAQQPQTLIDFTSTWKYDSSTTLGTAWTGTGFNDSAWLSGQGLLGFETTPGVYPVAFNTALVAPANGGPITYYFRFTFNFSGPTNGTTLIASNLVDDGCVVYLNGVEAGRLRVPTGQTPTTLASGGPGTEGAIETMTTISPGLLRQGANVMAVEVHQSAADSSDVAWGMKLIAFVPSALSITTQPQSQTIAVGSPVTFGVGISGGPANYQWQKNSNNIGGATSSSYTIGSVSANDAASYRVIVTNAVNSVTSQPAVLTVISDITPPKVLSAIVREVTSGTGTNTFLSFTNIELTVDEQLVGSTAQSTNNYRIYNYDTEAPVPVISALFNFPTIRLFVSTNQGWRYRSNYFVRVSGLTDQRGNVMPPTDIGVSWRISTNVVQMSGNWDFFTTSFIFDPNYLYYSNFYRTNFAVDYNNGWGTGPGILFYDRDQQTAACAGDTLQTSCGFQYDPCLFRRTFTMPPGVPNVGVLRMRQIIDDGAQVYLNGQEVYRYNMPAGTLVTTSKSISNINPATVSCITNIAVNVTNRLNLTGNNWLAAAVYQSTQNGDGEGDVVFGFEMDYEYLQTSPIPPLISIRRNGATIQVVWSGTGYSLQSSTNPANAASWANVAGATSPATAMPNTFYRLSKN